MNIINLITVFSALWLYVASYKLKQITIFSRHGLRSSNHNLTTITPNEWVQVSENFGQLTTKGAILESYMGGYFSDWLKNNGFLTNRCPGDDSVHIYASSIHRTIETAKILTKAVFAQCPVVIHHLNSGDWDPKFSMNMHNISKSIADKAISEVQKNANGNVTNLEETLILLENILDYNNSYNCKIEHNCSLFRQKIEVYFDENEQIKAQVKIKGALYVGFHVIDAFLTAFYNGLPIKTVTWGGITTDKQWQSLQVIRETALQLQFGIRKLAKHACKPLIDYMRNLFLDDHLKFSLIVGHDSNIISLFSVLQFKKYNLHDQYEKVPMGGKVVFQKWYDEINDRDLLKVNYVYQSTKQLRDAEKLTLENPPQWVTLEMENCNIDENGFCPWSDFINTLNEIVNI